VTSIARSRNEGDGVARRTIRTERWRTRWAATDVSSRRELWDPLHSGGQPQLHYTTTNVGEAMPGLLTPLTWSVRRAQPSCRQSGNGVFAIFSGRGAMQAPPAFRLPLWIRCCCSPRRQPGPEGALSAASVFRHLPWPIL
jgi:hypothetical protein